MEVKSSLPLNAGTPVKMKLKDAIMLAVLKYEDRTKSGGRPYRDDPEYDEMRVKQHVPPAPQKRKFKR